MLVAKQIRKENISEYILYLYQIEDLIRAFQFDMNLIQENLVTKYKADKNVAAEITGWYNNLVVMMEKEGINEKGHLQFITNLIADVNEFHMQLMQSGTAKVYIQNFRSVAGLLTELKEKNKIAKNDIQLALDTIYGFLLLKMKKAKTSAETENAVKQLSQWLNSLSVLYKKFEAGDLEI